MALLAGYGSVLALFGDAIESIGVLKGVAVHIVEIFASSVANWVQALRPAEFLFVSFAEQ